MSVRIERSGNRILLASEAPTPGLKNAIPGAYFRKDDCWSLPLDLATCHMLRDRFGNRLQIGPALTAWARAEKARRAAAGELATAADAEVFLLPTVAPKLHAAMASRTYQRAAVRYVADSMGRDGRRRALIGDTVGLGKTLEAIGAVLESGIDGPHLIVCPMGAVEDVWAPEIRRWLGDDAEVVTVPTGRVKRDAILTDLVARHDNWAREGLPQGPTSLARTWVVVHPAIVRTQTWWVCGQIETDVAGTAAQCGGLTKYKTGPVDYLDCGHEKDRRTAIRHDHEYPQLFGIQYGAVIADESDQILIKKTGTPNLQRRGMEMLRDLVREGGARIAMSGTPFRSKPHQIWSTLNWLDPVEFSGKWRFIQKYWKTGGYSGYEIVRDGFLDDREHLLLDELKSIMIRRTREQVRGDLPAKLYPSNVPEDSDLTPGIYLPMSPQQRKAYDAIVKEGEAEIEGGTLSPLGQLAEMTRMKQFASAPGRLVGGEFVPLAEGNKFNWIVEKLKELGFPDRPDTKVVIASQFTKLLNAFAAGVGKELKLNQKTWMGMITGEQTQTARSQVIEHFEDPDDSMSLLWINTKAGGSAITLDAADIMIIIDETYVDDEQQQLEGRIDNRQPERRIAPRSYYYLRSRDSIEELIAAGNAEAKKAGNRILNASQIARLYREKMGS